MKKKLKWILPLCLVILIAVGILAFFLRYRSAGDVQLQMISRVASRTELVQIREKGVRSKLLVKNNFSPWSCSPDERYLACSLRKGDRSLCRVYDLSSPKKPIFEAELSCSSLLVTNDARLIFLQLDKLFLSDASGTVQIDRDVTLLGGLNPDSTHFYYFTEPEKGHILLWEYDLSTCEALLLLEDADPSSLQLCRNSQGRRIVVAAQRQTLTGTAYDQVIDTDPTDENPLREKLKATAVSQDVRHLYRWVDGKQELLAENMYDSYFCSPVQGLVVHRVATLALPVEKLQDVRYATERKSSIRYCSRVGQRFALDGLNEASITFSDAGDIYAFTGSRLLLYHWVGGVPCAQTLMEDVDAFALVRDTTGEEVYYALAGGTLSRTTRNGSEVLAEHVTQAWLPCRETENDVKQSIGDLIYYRRYYNETTGTVSATYERRPHANAPDSYFYILQDGQERALLLAKRSELLVRHALADGSILAVQTGSPVGLPSPGSLGWVLGPDRVERMPASAGGTALGNTCVIPLN